MQISLRYSLLKNLQRVQRITRWSPNFLSRPRRLILILLLPPILHLFIFSFLQIPILQIPSRSFSFIFLTFLMLFPLTWFSFHFLIQSTFVYFKDNQTSHLAESLSSLILTLKEWKKLPFFCLIFLWSNSFIHTYIHSFILIIITNAFTIEQLFSCHWFGKYLLSTFCVSKAVLGTGYIVMKKMDMVPALLESGVWERQILNKSMTIKLKHIAQIKT